MSGSNVETSTRKEQRTNVTGPIQFQVNFDLIQVDSQIPLSPYKKTTGNQPSLKYFNQESNLTCNINASFSWR